MAPAQHNWSSSPTAASALSPFDAVIFDLDGVVTDTADIHALAWKELFDAVLKDPRAHSTASQVPFTDSDYRRFVDGRPREEGVRVFLQSRGITAPDGHPSDPPGTWSVSGLGARKNEIFNRRLKNGHIHVFPGTVDLVKRLRSGGVPAILATSSRNARAVLQAAQLLDVFDLIVDGETAAALRLPGKPDPALFLEAARAMGVSAARVAVIEDAVAGVQAARAGGFGLVVGIDRADRRADLETAGADIVLHDVSEFDIGLVLTHPWLLVYEGMDPAHEGHREALTTLGNGYMAVRGAAPESASDGLHYPGTYMAGIYNRLTSKVHGQQSEDEHMVNVPNWLPVDIAVEEGRWWSSGGLRLCSEHRELDMRRAVLSRHVVLAADDGRQLDVVQRRVVSAAQAHLAALETTLTARGWSGQAVVRIGLDAGITNSNIPAEALLAHRHLRIVSFGTTADGVDSVEVETSSSRIRIATAARIPGHEGGVNGGPATRQDSRVFRDVVLDLQDSIPAIMCKVVSMVSSRDTAISSPLAAALAVQERAPAEFDQILAAHEAAWQGLLDAFALELDTDRQTQLILNLHIFHLLQTLTPHTSEVDAGVPARGLHGEGYRGHVFWDELFVLPVLTSRLPVVARSVLDYRWRRLDAARDAARKAGLLGAMFPWQSGSDGREETPHWTFNPRIGDWAPDYSSLQRHSGLAVAFNTWQYFEATGDRAWLIRRGAEILVEVARLFTSMAVHDAETDRFHIHGVMGPDEYHTGYPDGPGHGLDDNAYTNVMAGWLCATALHLVRSVLQGPEQQELSNRLGIRPEELDKWEQVSHRMYVPFHGDGIISQFEGYGQLMELDWEHYRQTYGNIERLDLILEAEHDTPNRYMLAKQADVLMLFYLLGEEQLTKFLGTLGYAVDSAALSRTVDFYLSRTAHGSTLSRMAHASVLAAMDPERAWSTFREALDADLDDTQGGTTRAGIHLGAMAGSIDTVQRTFAGLRMAQDELIFAPRLPTGLHRVRFTVNYRGQLLEVALDHERLTVTAAPGVAAPVRVRLGLDTVMLHAGQSHGFLVRRSP
ncbi:putative glycosyl hydrolase MT2062 [Arthrobacter sp. Bi83]|jgi:beta-phosphoglucomutase family hydrolase|uniref:beta-phosphoglucomutase family hydrolase n=1 Tax=Arthrobacter sp. Bi83 TaxID=2822353 RepID=UPI001DFC9896|nr:beta-phosphoglucomutase family hydrolase [Arthrobacter sp. Bi83]CAH0130944.1 putative glycosyl hydrolase MT2062 [Arthrobacter sp. Bi83]